MSSPENALQAAVFAALSSDAALTALIGANAIHDGLIDRAPFPYVVMSRMATRDWSTASDTGTEHRFSLDVWSRAGGRREVQEIAAIVRDALHDRPLALSQGSLVNLRFEKLSIDRQPKTRLQRARLDFRAAIEA